MVATNWHDVARPSLMRGNDYIDVLASRVAVGVGNASPLCHVMVRYLDRLCQVLQDRIHAVALV